VATKEYSIKAPDGSVIKFRAPDDAPKAKILAFAKQQYEARKRAPVEADISTEQEPPKSSDFDQSKYDKLLAINPQMAQAYAAQQSQSVNAKQSEIDRDAKLAELEKTNPFQAKALREMGSVEAAAINIGAGLTDIWAGLPFTKNKSDEIRAIEAQTELTNPKASIVGRAVGQTLPVLPLSVIASAPASIAGRVVGQSAAGAAQGGLIAKGTGGNEAEVLKSAIAGGLIGGGLEALIPVVRRAGGALAARLGDTSAGALLDDLGRPTARFNRLLQQNNTTFADFVASAADDSGADVAKVFANAAETNQAADIAESVAVAAPSARRAQAARELGLDADAVPLGVMSENRATQELYGALAARPASTASTVFDSFTEGLSQKADDLISGMGGSIDRGAMSSEVIGGMQDAIKKIRREEDLLYGQIRQNIGADLIVNAKPLKNLLSSRARTRRGIENLSKAERDIFKLVKDGKMSYANLDDAIADIGAAIGRETDVYSNVRLSVLNDLYGKLSDLRIGVAGQFGLKDQLLEAKKIGAKRFALQDATKTLAGDNLTGSIFPQIDGAIAKLSAGEVNDFRAKMELIPPEYRQKVLATSLNRALTGGRDSSRQLDATQYAKWYRNLTRAPAGSESAAYKSLKQFAPPEAVRRLDNIYELAQGVSSVKANRIRTGIQLDTYKRLDQTADLAAKLYSLADKYQTVPGVGSSATFAGNVAKLFAKERTPAVDAVDQMINSKAFKDAIINAARSGTGSSSYRAAAARLKSSDQYKVFLRQLDKNDVTAITASGLVPWLTKDEEGK
jgi:hypothetical protein